MAAALSYQKPAVVEAAESASATVIWLHGISVFDSAYEPLDTGRVVDRRMRCDRLV